MLKSIIVITVILHVLTQIIFAENISVSNAANQTAHARSVSGSPVLCNASNAHGKSSGGHAEGLRTRFSIIEVGFHHVKPMYMVTCWLLAACVLKILFHMAPWLSSHVPESAALITLGILLGVILKFAGVGAEHYKLDAHTFFYFMLPPIVFDSGFHMPNRAFFSNIGTILLFAVVGTIFNATSIGLTLWGVCTAVNYEIGVLECLLYGSLVSAVDPVGVLSVFEEVHVNEMLYIIVFGESLLNDAVTVVLYNVFSVLIEIDANGSIIPRDIIYGIISVFVVGIGGVAIGVFFGLLTAFVTRFTDHVRVIEPIFIFIFGYLSYLTAEFLKMSGILAAVFCGITMRRYVNTNVHRKSQTTINYAVKMLAVVSETVVFMFIGMTSVLDLIDFNAAFFFTSLAACAIFRPIGVIFGSLFINKFRTIKLTWLDQFIMSYGGLRGPIAYALCALISKELIPQRDVLLSACMGVIFFTCYVQGGTIRFLVEGLHVKRQTKTRPTMNHRIHERLLDHAMAGIEDIAGVHGSQYLRVMWEAFDNRFLKPLLLKEVPQTREQGIIKTFSKLNIQDAIKQARERGSSSQLSDQDRNRPPGVAFHGGRRFNHESVAEALNLVFARGNSSAMFGNQGTMTPTDTALDLQMLDAPVRKKDMDDARIRHILDDSMYKPKSRGKTRQIATRHNLIEHEPAFPHQTPKTRWEVRELMSRMAPSQSRQRRYPQVSFSRSNSLNQDRAAVVNEIDGEFDISNARPDRGHGGVEGDDEGITMSPNRHSTVAERQLPWHRSTDEPTIASRKTQSNPRLEDESQDSPEEEPNPGPSSFSIGDGNDDDNIPLGGLMFAVGRHPSPSASEPPTNKGLTGAHHLKAVTESPNSESEEEW